MGAKRQGLAVSGLSAFGLPPHRSGRGQRRNYRDRLCVASVICGLDQSFPLSSVCRFRRTLSHSASLNRMNPKTRSMKALSIANTGAAVSRPSQILHASLEIEPAPHGIGKFCLLGRDMPSKTPANVLVPAIPRPT